jgi:hypothetical protein
MDCRVDTIVLWIYTVFVFRASLKMETVSFSETMVSIFKAALKTETANFSETLVPTYEPIYVPTASQSRTTNERGFDVWGM